MHPESIVKIHDLIKSIKNIDSGKYKVKRQKCCLMGLAPTTP